MDVIDLRSRVGMVFQKPTPFPMSIFDNVAFGLRLKGIKGTELKDRVEKALKDAALWDEVKDRLKRQCLLPLGRTTAKAMYSQGYRSGARSFTF